MPTVDIINVIRITLRAALGVLFSPITLYITFGTVFVSVVGLLNHYLSDLIDAPFQEEISSISSFFSNSLAQDVFYAFAIDKLSECVDWSYTLLKLLLSAIPSALVTLLVALAVFKIRNAVRLTFRDMTGA